MKSDEDPREDEPTARHPVASPTDARVTVSGAELAADAAGGSSESGLPHWTEAPTGQVPIVVAGEPSDDPWAGVPAPAWREGEADWVAHEEQFDASMLAGAPREAGNRPWEFSDEPAPPTEEQILDEAPRPEPAPEPTPIARTRRAARGDLLVGRAVRHTPGRSVSLATATGLGLAVVAVAAFLASPLAVLVLVLIVMVGAAGEALAGFRRAGAHPATILALVAVAVVDVAVYNKGLPAVAAITVLLVILGFIWYFSAFRLLDVLDGLGATIFVFAWVGILGSYAVALVAPQYSPDRHGMAILFGALVLTVANDTGALFVGRWIGRRPLSKALSPHKTVEGLIGGAVVTMVLALVVSRMHPWTMSLALEAGVAVAIVAPLGDLFESMVKRTLGVKDLGRILPGHGGLLDRIDSLLFVLPTVFYLVHAVHPV
ncbi:MAG: phosphatidate cytidylyltransferase [Acidimicrobiales bacterium]